MGERKVRYMGYSDARCNDSGKFQYDKETLISLSKESLLAIPNLTEALLRVTVCQSVV